MRPHALLSASGAERWLNCTPSARLEDQLPEPPSEHAAEGTLAHAIAELKARKQFLEPMPTRTFNAAMKKLKSDKLYQEEMQPYTDAYLDYISGVVHSFPSPPYVPLEKKLDFSRFVPEGFGTGDCIIIGGNKLYIIDFKYGKGVPVSAENNPQMLLYAVGALEAYSILYSVSTVVLSIVQPRLNNSSEHEVETGSVLNWAETVVMPKAKNAFHGEGEFVNGDHCQFCRAKALCRARAEANMEIEPYKGSLPPLISNDEVGELLFRAKDLAKWAKALEVYALTQCLQGNSIPGWKAVEGRSSRIFNDVDAAFKVLTQNGTDKAMLYVTEALSVAQTEALVGKKQFNELLSTYIVNSPGKPTLAPENDKREPITVKTSAAEDFKNDDIPF